ncbi:UNVERIFIED_CONTAM: hypothetical protein Sradi_7216000 [Sesamum radiatum]|uniref:Uncharacterized protein n=1 Tax=Sesamum radiatum TaxID=300843 RepID=A0AAW2INY0_SESRA
MFLYLARLLSETDIPQGRGCFRPDYPFLTILTLPGPGPLPEDGLWYLWCLAALYYFPIEVNLGQMIAHLQDIKNGKSLVWVFLSWFDDVKDWLRQFQQLHQEGKSYHIIILHRPYYAGTGEVKPLPFYHQWRSLQKPLNGQKDEEQELARHLCFVNKIPFPAQRPRLVYAYVTSHFAIWGSRCLHPGCQLLTVVRYSRRLKRVFGVGTKLKNAYVTFFGKEVSRQAMLRSHGNRCVAPSTKVAWGSGYSRSKQEPYESTPLATHCAGAVIHLG